MMGGRIIVAAIIFLSTVVVSRTDAASDEQLSAIEELGQLNGVALQCKYLQETRRIKKALVAALPKKRHLGKIFEDATNESFLKFIEDNTACPGESILTRDVTTGIEKLNGAFR